jgi:sulfur-carrier protein
VTSPLAQGQPPQPILVTVRLFAAVREAFGQSELVMELPTDSTVRSLSDVLCLSGARQAAVLAHTTVAVNQRFAAPDTILHEGDEVAFLPPVGGGR